MNYELKTITFRPLRKVKKTGLIVVASYSEWRKIMTADYNKFNLIVNNEYKEMPRDEFVYNHKGELLYFFTYNPADVIVLQRTIVDDEDFDYDGAGQLYKDFIIQNDGGKYGSP